MSDARDHGSNGGSTNCCATSVFDAGECGGVAQVRCGAQRKSVYTEDILAIRRAHVFNNARNSLSFFHARPRGLCARSLLSILARRQPLARST